MRTIWKSTAVAVGIGLLASSAASADMFTYAGVTWEQDNTPDVLELIGNNVLLDGAQFTDNLPNRITRSVGFIAVSGTANSGFTGVPGFMPELSLGRQANAQQGVTQSDGTSSLFSSAVNLPRGNDGDDDRHGLEVSWTGGRRLTNEAGDDFVVYESGSNSSSPEGFMVRARKSDGTYTPWHYETYDAFQIYTETPNPATTGVFAHLFDLSDMGVAPGAQVDQIQIANLQPDDRIDAMGGFATSGEVIFDDPNGGLALPAATPAANSTFGGSSLDPDPLWVGIISGVGADGACCTDGPNANSECIETDQDSCEADGGLFLGAGVSCDQIDDCVPLYVEIESLSAVPAREGVRIEWTTTTEIDTVGFRILRETPGARAKSMLTIVTPFVPSAGENTSGASYVFVDRARFANAGTVYYLESIDRWGRLERFGPVQLSGSRRR